MQLYFKYWWLVIRLKAKLSCIGARETYCLLSLLKVCHYTARNTNLRDNKRMSKLQGDLACNSMLFETGHCLFLLPYCCFYEEKVKVFFLTIHKTFQFFPSWLVKYPFNFFIQGLNQQQKYNRLPVTEVDGLWQCSDISGLFSSFLLPK